MIVTVLTPTYNRAYRLSFLYNSLLKQTNKNFEWVVVDDGSTDNTSDLIREYREQSTIKIKYIKKENGGKHTAINSGILQAKGKVTIIVDSDDFLTEDAIEKILKNFELVDGKKEYAGICFRKIDLKSNKILGKKIYQKIDCTLLEYKYKYKVREDIAECFKTKVLKENKFPTFNDEKFVPESLVWNRISKKNLKFKFFEEAIYYCEYLEDGYSRNLSDIKLANFKGYLNYYIEEIFFDKIPFRRKIMCLFHIINLIIKKIGEKIKCFIFK